MMEKETYCLLVEDDPEDQEFFIDALHQASATTGCYAVANGEEALMMLQQPDFTPDYIFTDLNMPGMDGFELLEVLQRIERLRDIPVIVYSSDCPEEQLAMIKKLGAAAFYRKTRVVMLREILRKYFPAGAEV